MARKPTYEELELRIREMENESAARKRAGEAQGKGEDEGTYRLIVEHAGEAIFVAQGGKVEVPTLDGAAKLSVPAGTQSHQLFRLREKGLPQLNSRRRGDLIVRLVCWTPARLGRDEQKLLEELERLQAGKLPGPRRPA